MRPFLNKQCRTVGGGFAALLRHTLHNDGFLGDGQYVFEAKQRPRLTVVFLTFSVLAGSNKHCHLCHFF